MAWTTREWTDMAVSIASSIEVEYCCDRRLLVDESSVVRFAAQFLQARWSGDILPEQQHPDIAGKKLDIVGKRGGANPIHLALEAKYVRSGIGTVSWLRDIAVDLLRTHATATGANQYCDRLLLVAGEVNLMEAQVWNKSVQATTTGDPRVRAVPHLLPTVAGTEARFELRTANVTIRRWLTKVHSELGREFPNAYRAKLVARFKSRDDGAEVALWRISRIQNCGTFIPDKTWAGIP